MQQRTNRTDTRKTRTARPLGALAVVVALVIATVGGSYAWALYYNTANYAWFTGDSDTYTIHTAGELAAFSHLVDGTWIYDDIAFGEDDAHVSNKIPDNVRASLHYKAADFAGITVRLGNGLNMVDAATLAPIGTGEHPFNGTFDGQGNYITNLRLTNVPDEDEDGELAPLQYVGLFGHVGAEGRVQDLTLGRNCAITLAGTQAADHIAYVGSVAGYCEGSLANVVSQAAVRITWDDGDGGNTRYDEGYENVYVIDGVGGIAGYCDGDVEGAAFKGSINVNTPANASWITEADQNEAVVARYIGGIVGRSGGDPNTAGVAGQAYGALVNCTNTGDIDVATTGAGGTDRFGETVDSKSRYVGGIAGYAIGNIDGCKNAGDITATSHAEDADLSAAQNLAAHRASDGGAEGAGGIVGGFRSQGAGGSTGRAIEGPAADDSYNFGGIKVDRGIAGEGGSAATVQITNCVNTGAVMACNNVGGIAGATGTFTRVYRCANGDAKLYAQDDEVGHVTSVRWNKPNTGGLVGRCYGDIAYSRNHGEVQTTKGGYYVGGLAGDLYYYRDANNDKFVTPEVYACYNTGQVVCSKAYRRGALLGGNGGYIHDCLFLYGTSSAAEDEGIFAIGQEKGEDNPLKANLGIAYASDSQAASHGADAFSLKSASAVAWLNNSAMRTDKLTGETGWDSEVYYMATPSANRGYPVLLAEGVASTTRIDLEALEPDVQLAEDAAFTTAYNPTPKLRVTITVNGEEQQLVENADYYVVPDPAALENGVCKGTTNGERIYTAQVRGIGNYESQPFGEVAYAIGQGDFAECSISAVTDTFTGAAQTPQVTVLDPAGGVVDAGTYDIVVNEGKPCIAPDSYAVVATAKANSNYVGHCTGTYAVSKIDIARDCDVIGVVYEESVHGGVAEELADADASPRVWLYDDETYRLYEVTPQIDAAGALVTYTQADLDALRGTAIPAEAPDEVVAGYVGYPVLAGFEVYKEDDGDRWLTRATPAVTDDAGATVYGMELEYTAGELRPDVIGVNWAQGKLQFTADDGTVDVPWRLIFGGGSGGSTASRENARAAEGTLNIESSSTGAITVARYDTGYGRYLTNYDVITFGIARATVDAGEISISQDGAKTVYKEGELVKPPELTLRYKGNVVDAANYAITVDRVLDSGGREVSRRTAYLEGDTVFYKVTLKGSLACSEAMTHDDMGNALSCVVVKEQTALTADRFEITFDDSWERIEDASSVDKWKKAFTMDEGIDKPVVSVVDTQAVDSNGDTVRKELHLGTDYELWFSYEDRTGGWRLGGWQPSVRVVGKNAYAGNIMVYYRIEKGVITQADLDSLAAGSIRDADGNALTSIGNVNGTTSNNHNPLANRGQYVSACGPYVAYRPHGYTADELGELLGIHFWCDGWGGGADALLFDVSHITRDGKDVTSEGMRELGDYEVTIEPAAVGWGTYSMGSKKRSAGGGSVYFDVEQGASATLVMRVVEPNLSNDWLNAYPNGEGNALVYMLDYATFRLSLASSISTYYGYTATEYAYTGYPVKPRYLILDNDASSTWPARQRRTVTDAESGESRLETDDEVLARLVPHAFSYDDYEVVVEGFENVAGANGCPTDVGEDYQVVSVKAAETGPLTGCHDALVVRDPENRFNIIAADISDPDTVGIAVGSAAAPNDAEANVGFIGANGAEPEVRFYVDSDGNGTYDADEQCAYVEGVDYEVEYLNNQDITEGADATARIWVKDARHLSAAANGTHDLLRGWYYDVPFRVEGDAVYLDGADVTWSLSDTLVVDESGALSAPVGSARYTVGEGDAAVTKVVPQSAYTLQVGTVEDGAFTPKASGWSAGDAAFIAVQPTNAAGRFTLEGAGAVAVVGQAQVVASTDENDFAAAGSKLTTALDGVALVYDGSGQTPAVTVSLDGSEEPLVEGEDFELAYADNVNAGEGTASVAVTGVGAYTGTRTLSFSIQKRDLVDCTVTCDDMPYTGNQVTPGADAVHVLAGDVELAADEAGWEVVPDAYGANLNAGADSGSLTVEASADGNLTGSKTVTFAIVGRSLADCDIPAYRYQTPATPVTGRALTVEQFNANGGIVITDTALERDLVVGQDFTVVGIANADGFANGNDDTATGSVRYLGYATLTVRGTGNYSDVATVNIPLAAKSLADATVEFAEGEGGPYAYTGEEIRPGVVVALGDEELEQGVDYQLAFTANRQAGTASITVRGMGAYSGSAATSQLTFQIEPVQVSAANASYTLAVSELAYSGTAVKVSGTLVLRGENVSAGNVKLAYAALNDGTEELLDAAPVEPGDYRVTATATAGSLLGSAQADFSIVPASLSPCSLSIGRAAYAFGDAVQPEVRIVTPAKGEVDPAAVGCEVSYEPESGTWNIGDAAFATVRATDDSRYFTGSMSGRFTVGRIPLARGDVDFADDTELAFTGEQVLPALHVTVGGRALEEGQDFTVSPLSTDLVNPGAKTLEVLTPEASVYEATNVLVSYRIVKEDEPETPLVVPDALKAQTITVTGANAGVYAKTFGNAPFSLGAKASGGGKLSYTVASGADVVSVNASGTVSIKKAGTAKVTIRAAANGVYLPATMTVTVKVAKAKNTLAAKAKKKTVALKYAKLKKKAQAVVNLKVSKAKGKLTYSNVSTKKAAKKFKVNAKGKLVVPKKTKKGTYAVKVKVTAAGTASYKAISKTVSFKVRVK